MKNLSKIIKDKRIKRGLSQQRLAEILNLDQSTISRAEKKFRGMSFETIFKILKELEIKT